MKIETIMLFAAGIGSRMRHLTTDNPKTLLPVLGKPILYHSLELCRSYPFKKIIINTHYLPEKIEEALAEFQKQNPDFPKIITIHEEELLETGGAIKNAIDLIGQDPIFTLNTDIILKSDGSPFEDLQKSWDPDKMDFLLLMQPFDKAIGYRGRGDFEIDKKGALSRPDKKDNYSYMYAGLQILNPLKVAANSLKVFSLREYYLSSSRVFGLVAKNTKWYHATTPEDIVDIEMDM
jgi:MurNAc alpha-1-phosphate uridylyltransferase